MKIPSEIKLIKELTRGLKKVGDDAAVIKQGKNYLLLTTDILVENDHFNCSWSTPQQIGQKAVEVNVADIAAMGGKPTFMLVSLVLPKKTDYNWIKKLYQGLRKTCQKYKISLIGGDTTHGQIKVINITLLGKTKKPILRSGAKINDLICVTGKLGGSTAGLKLLRENKPVPKILKQKHLESKARLDISGRIAKYAHSMIDVSDGLASEVRHLCEQSKKGAIIYADKIPLIKGASLEEALSGGEDFELLFTMNKNNLKKLKVPFTVIGKIINKKIYLIKKSKKLLMPQGYDHFRKN